MTENTHYFLIYTVRRSLKQRIQGMYKRQLDKIMEADGSSSAPLAS